jgi:histidine triad (HIT) family protein
MKDCIFCAIVHESADKHVWENEVAVAIKDLYPRAKVHVLLMPKQHIRNLDHLENAELAGTLLMSVREVAHRLNLKDNWQLRVNNGHSVGQTVDHLHFHIMGGQKLAEE